jgi:molybdopterin/thiamine biosynthesis adenylyltransferase/rhodanese-related sulfurtransferase
MMTNTRDQFYLSHSKLSYIGPNGQLKLNAAKVLVIGAGGLGCPCLQMLAGCGIGTIAIADFDTVSVSNLHRQTLYNFNDVGKPKAATAQLKLQQINPYIAIKEDHIFVDESNVLSLVADYDLVVDGTDNFAVRYLINDACVYLSKPLVYGAIYQTEGHVTVFNHQGSATLRCLFPEPSVEVHVQSCAEVGAYNVVTNIIGTMMANEVVKLVLDNHEVLANKLVSYDALSSEMRTIIYRENPKSRSISVGRFKTESIVTEIPPDEFLKLLPDTYRLIDVREDWEHDEFNIGGIQIALAKFKRFDFSGYDRSDKIIVYCLQGLRSYSAAQFLRESGFKNAVSLRGGLNAYLALK